MKFDRILIEFADWLRQVLWKRKGVVKGKPYEVLKTWRGKYAIITQVDRPTPRAVATYVVSPFRYDKPQSAVKDYHLCFDHLGAVEGSGAISSGFGHTHRISVYRASHFLNKNGQYDLEAVYTSDFDLQRSDPYRDRNALMIAAKLITYIKNEKPDAINWKREIENTVKQWIGGKWNTPTPEKSSENSVVEGVILDGAKKGKRVRLEISKD